MLTTIYKDEIGKIVSLHLHAENEDDREKLQKAAEHFNKEDAVEPEEIPADPPLPEEPEPVPASEPEPDPVPEPEVIPDEDTQPVHENTTVQ